MLIVFLSGESKFQSTDRHFSQLPTLLRALAAKKSPAVLISHSRSTTSNERIEVCE